MDTPTLYATVFSLLPPLLAIVLALITKEVFSSLIAGIILGGLLAANGNIPAAFQTVLYHEEGGLVTGLTSMSHISTLTFAAITWILVTIMNKSGSVAAFGRWAQRHVRTRVGAQLLTVLMGMLIFVDDGFNCLTVGSVMHPITDRYKISRAKLAYIIDSTAAPICIIAPISSWAAAVSSTVPESLEINGFQMFIRIIPYNLYALVTIVMVFLIITMNLSYGPMKKYEKNALEKGDLFTVQTSQNIQEIDDHGKGKISNLILPVIVLIISCVTGMIYTGGFFEGASIIDSFANCDARGLVMGGMFTLLFTFALYMIRRTISFRDFMHSLPEGLAGMAEPMIILILSWALAGMTGLLGAGEYINHLVSNSAASFVMFLPFLVFVISVGLSFASGTSWGTFSILIPIVCTVFPDNETMLMISIAACLSGAVCGDHCSPISDTTILSSAGAGCDHVSHVSTQLPYALTAAAVSSVGFLLSGILGYQFGSGMALLATPVTFVLTGAVLTVLRSRTEQYIHTVQ